MKRALPTLALIALTTLALLAANRDTATSLRNQGLAELENEKPVLAQAIFERLIEVEPKDPLGYANLAIALLRQQHFDTAAERIDEALKLLPGDAALLAIQGEIHHWAGRPEEALEVFRRAADAAPDKIEIQHSLYRQATTTGVEAADAAAGEALDRLARLRPENLVVMLQVGQRARQSGDRAAATAAFLRIRELLWQAPDVAQTLIVQVLDALEADDLDRARVPMLRLENVLKVTAMYKESLRELSPGIQGIPIQRFRQEAPPTSFGAPSKIRFARSALGDADIAAVAVGDLDGDSRADIIALAGDRLVVRLAANDWRAAKGHPAAGRTGLQVADLDNDGSLDVIAHGSEGLTVWRGDGAGNLMDSTSHFGLQGATGRAATVIDFDIEGDLDLVLGGAAKTPLALWANSLETESGSPLSEVGKRTFPQLDLGAVEDLVATDLDRDGDLDLLLAHAGGLVWLDNLRQGRFADRTQRSGLASAPALRAVVSADLDNDGWPDIIGAGSGLTFFRNREGQFEPWDRSLRTSAEFATLEVADVDNDGRLDIAVGGEAGLVVLGADDDGPFRFLPSDAAAGDVRSLAASDLDGDGDLDLVVGGSDGLQRFDNQGGNDNRWLAVRLRGLDKGNSKNNLFGFGSTVEVLAGSAFQFREVRNDVTHFGLGRLDRPDQLRVVWTNGVPQNRLQPEPNQMIVEEQLLKGSCPFLYAWDGEEVTFVTDLLWGAPAGLPAAPGVWIGADPQELVRVDGIQPRGARYDLRITEELWEAAFFDYVRLWVVDHPAAVEVVSSLKIVPGSAVPEAVYGSRDVRPVAAAWDAAGSEVTSRVARRDEIYADGWRRSPYQGVAAEPWAFTFDLGTAPRRPIRLHLDGWIFPADASLNLAVAQRTDYPYMPPRLEVLSGSRWQTLVASMGHPAGKTKTMLVDTPALPAGARKLRIVSNQWLSWDRIAWSISPADDEPIVRGRLAADIADLHFRGFSAPLRRAPNAPHTFDYTRVSLESPWLVFPGSYTRYGDVRELLDDADDRSVILAAGDEITLSFDAGSLEETPPGWRRTLFLESHGWDKDADRNTWEAQQMEPLPFRAMATYGDPLPDTAALRRYQEEWLTRTVAAEHRTPLVRQASQVSSERR